MTLQQFYQTIQGDYEDMCSRFSGPERVQRFVLLFPQDDSYAQFLRAMADGDSQTAFRAIHTLKGLCLNLGFGGMLPLVSQITEALRGGDLALAREGMPQLAASYRLHLDAIAQLERTHHG